MSPTTSSLSSSSASSSSSSTPPRRQSCDRCHSQKLRCTRASNGGSSNSPTGVCNRCLRLGAQCIYSPCLPKGRPAGPRPPPTPAPTPTFTYAPASDKETPTAGKKNNPVANQRPLPLSLPLPRPDELLSLDHLDHLDNLDNLEVDSSLVWPTWVPPLETVDWSVLNMNMNMNMSMNMSMDMDVDVDRDAPGTAPPLAPLAPAATASTASTASDPVDVTSEASEPHKSHCHPSAVYHLSELITRLYALHRQSSALSEAATAGRASGLPLPLLINDATFPPVAAWLQHLSANPDPGAPHSLPLGSVSLSSTPAGETLHATFAAAQSLLAVLDRLRLHADPQPATATSSSSTAEGVDAVDLWDMNVNTPQSSSASSYCDAAMPTPASATAPPRPSLLHSSNSTVVRHLVGACHSLLMNVFIGPLDALQHDAELSQAQSTQTTQAAQANAHPAQGSDASDLAHLRLAMVSHLCSYLIRRLQHAVSSYSSPSWSGSESLSDLDNQIGKRLAQLPATLHI